MNRAVSGSGLAGVTIFVHEIAPDPAAGYDFTTLKEMLTWRDHHN